LIIFFLARKHNVLGWSQKTWNYIEEARVQQQGQLGNISHRQCHVLVLQADVVADNITPVLLIVLETLAIV
jgi:hypothetical protein